MTTDNSFPVSYRLTHIRETVGPYARGSVWAEPDLAHAAELMRRVYERRDLAERVGRQAAEDVRALLHPRIVGARVRSLLDGVQDAEQGRGAGRPLTGRAAWPG